MARLLFGPFEAERMTADDDVAHARGPLHIHLFTGNQTHGEVAWVLRCAAPMLGLGHHRLTHHAVNIAIGTTRGESDASYEQLRIELPELLPRVSKLLWIDNDAVVRDDVASLMQGLFVGEDASCSTAAVLRPISVRAGTRLTGDQLRYLGLTRTTLRSSFFNAGVLGLNLVEWHRHSIAEAVRGMQRRLRDELKHTLPGSGHLSADPAGRMIGIGLRAREP
ncbi:hypothetical protein EMIHUDRAFT_243641 [Emiliania huxleyi CCMP1516]|uniref:Uncharacterized protein n=2 Tax=Emiliania huxleyi TaxID=2903 RepID=A0A0D3J559_EMIH1|nr:hypothetical protein EMIHUDRAFT_243641 [Emiliania huxleyi CCMP1516]EOD18644.1 hypothetical protein EMIHUDRAFT_243641 [Emiliania huxleyi CCMP1516]|eukprot:XP_005771073.1 hypothetical protein EMIHUDRAFT_243641 [Emiliania huxleyi CCMP1516]